MSDISNGPAIKGGITAAKAELDAAFAEVVAEETNPSNYGLERAMQRLGKAINILGQTVFNAAGNIDA